MLDGRGKSNSRNLNVAQTFSDSETKLIENSKRRKKNVLSHQIFRKVAELLDLILISFYFSCPSSGRDAREQ